MSRDSTQYCAKGGYHGRLTYDSWNTYWDGQGKLASVYPGNGTSTCGSSGWCLTYDALGRMVELNASGTYTEMLYSPIGKTAIMSGQTVTKVWYPVPGGGTVLASSSNWPHYQHADWLGTARLQTEFSGTLGNSPRTVDYDRSFAPFGEMYDSTGADAYDLDFTGDVKTMWSSGLLDTPNRELHPTQGRWISPDPAGLGAVDQASPQSWNRYAYVSNMPLTMIDPSGEDMISPDGVERDVVGTGRWGIQDPNLDPGGAWLAEQTQEFKAQAGLLSPAQEALARYLWQVGAGSWVSGPSGPGGFGCDGPRCWYLKSEAANNGSGGCQNVNGSYVCPTNIDKYNPMERGKTNLRDFNLFCSTHVTIDQTTGQTGSHVDLINPEPLPTGPISPAVWPVLHVIYDGFPDLVYRTTGHYLVPPGRSMCQ